MSQSIVRRFTGLSVRVVRGFLRECPSRKEKLGADAPCAKTALSLSHRRNPESHMTFPRNQRTCRFRIRGRHSAVPCRIASLDPSTKPASGALRLTPPPDHRTQHSSRSRTPSLFRRNGHCADFGTPHDGTSSSVTLQGLCVVAYQEYRF